MAKTVRDPRIRISRRIKKDKVFKVKVKFDHPSFTGTCLSIMVTNWSAVFECHPRLLMIHSSPLN